MRFPQPPETRKAARYAPLMAFGSFDPSQPNNGNARTKVLQKSAYQAQPSTRIALVFILLWQEMVRRARKKCLYQARCKPLLRKDIVHRYPSCSDPVQLRIQDSHANARLSLC
jgi:hypothetical protein